MAENVSGQALAESLVPIWSPVWCLQARVGSRNAYTKPGLDSRSRQEGRWERQDERVQVGLDRRSDMETPRGLSKRVCRWDSRRGRMDGQSGMQCMIVIEESRRNLRRMAVRSIDAERAKPQGAGTNGAGSSGEGVQVRRSGQVVTCEEWKARTRER